MKTFLTYRDNGVETIGANFWLPQKHHAICRNRFFLLQRIFTAVVKVRAYSSCLGSFNCGLINRRPACVVASH